MIKFVVTLATFVSLGLAVPAFAEEMAKPHMIAKPHMMVVHHHYHHHYHHMMKPETKPM